MKLFFIRAKVNALRQPTRSRWDDKYWNRVRIIKLNNHVLNSFKYMMVIVSAALNIIFIACLQLLKRFIVYSTNRFHVDLHWQLKNDMSCRWKNNNIFTSHHLTDLILGWMTTNGVIRHVHIFCFINNFTRININMKIYYNYKYYQIH